jgi:hypothetical protein
MSFEPISFPVLPDPPWQQAGDDLAGILEELGSILNTAGTILTYIIVILLILGGLWVLSKVFGSGGRGG